MVKYCPECGAENDDKDTYCHKCGAENKEEDEFKVKHVQPIIIGLIISVVLIFIIDLKYEYMTIGIIIGAIVMGFLTKSNKINDLLYNSLFIGLPFTLLQCGFYGMYPEDFIYYAVLFVVASFIFSWIGNQIKKAIK